MKIVTTLVNAIGTKFEVTKMNRAQLLPYPYPCMHTNERENETLQTDSECTKSTQSIAATLALQCSACTCPRAGRHHGTYKSTWAKSVEQMQNARAKEIAAVIDFIVVYLQEA